MSCCFSAKPKDLPGNVLLEQAVRQVMTTNNPNHIVFYTESMDAGRFPDTNHYDLFGEYIKNKYMGQKLRYPRHDVHGAEFHAGA